MSGGNKKKAKTQGWEEAGFEFYQERYSAADSELEVLQRNPQRLATLLPSKQTRAAATTNRLKPGDTKSHKRQTSARSRRESTVPRRSSVAHDVQVSMLPDLSENISTEQSAWEEIMQIKEMPVSMAQKKDLKSKTLNQPNLRLQGYEQFKWKRRKMWERIKIQLYECYNKLELWKGDLKRIEGHFGIGVVSYFIFLKWLLFINVTMSWIIFIFILLPTILKINSFNDVETCFLQSNDTFILFDIAQGSGFMENTLLFYGFYPLDIFQFSIGNVINVSYNLPLAYISVALTCFIISLIGIVKSGTEGFKERLIESEGQFYLYCNLIFGGWDFCIQNEKSAFIKHKGIYNEIKGSLDAEKVEEKRQNRTRNQKAKLYLIRFVVNVIVFLILAVCAFAIYQVFNLSIVKHQNINLNKFEQLLFEFLPSITIVCLNLIIPFTFEYLIKYELYSQMFIVRMTLTRTIFLRLASLIVLYATLYYKINYPEKDKGLECWETYVGQQIYKLYMTDFARSVIVTFFINFPRAFAAKHINNKFFMFVGEQNFDLPGHVLDVVYTQTLCWLGCFYAPILPLMAIARCFLTFYIKKFACLVNSKPSSTIYRVSRSNSMFMTVLLISYVFAIIPTAFSVSELMRPSICCGPFKNTTYVWATVENAFSGSPYWFQTLVSFMSTPGFVLPLLIVFILLLYYYTAVNSANRHMVTVLKNQLVLEGHDKQFLLDRLSMFIKQQENYKKTRRIDTSGDAEKNSTD